MSQFTQLQNRRYDLDWLRVFAILLVLLFHVGMFFVHWPWHIKNPETSRGFGYVMVFLHQWRMPLLLFISGAGTMLAFSRRSKGEFALERTRRLFVPLIFSMLVVVPPQIYFERIASYSSCLDFYRTVFDFVPYPMGGSFSWLHMWFVLYLFLYSLIAIPIIAFLRSERSAGCIAWIERYFARPWGFISYALLIIFSQAILRPYFPDETHTLIDDWAYATQLFLFFLAGLVVSVSPKLWEILLRRRRNHLMAALASLTLMEVLYAVDWDSLQPYLTVDVETIWDVNTLIVAWTWVIAIIGYGQRYLNKKSIIRNETKESGVRERTISCSTISYLFRRIN
ncbi:MAG: acyltransferase [bacterium]